MPARERPLPYLNREETKPYWDACRRREIVIQRCGDCKTWIWYPQEVCHVCNSWNIQWERVSGRGKIYSWIVVHQALHPYFVDQAPYNVALVELDDAPGVRITTNILDCPPGKLRIGMPVEVVFQEVSEELTMPYFRPSSS